MLAGGRLSLVWIIKIAVGTVPVALSSGVRRLPGPFVHFHLTTYTYMSTI
jgi:hypothetical protein